ELEGMIDLVEMKCLKYRNDLGSEIEEIEIGEEELDRGEEGGGRLMEGVAESREELMEKYVGEEEI
uniref:hypothetical protein n=1 Tax=Staphylococcus aureus TaxID=1280 RepID=UPI001C92BBC6